VGYYLLARICAAFSPVIVVGNCLPWIESSVAWFILYAYF